MIIYKVEDNQENKEEKGFLRGVLNSLTSFFTPSDESKIRHDVNTARIRYNLVCHNPRSLDYFNRNPFLSLTIPVLKKELNYKDKHIASLVEYAIIISCFRAISLDSCIKKLNGDKRYGKHEFSIVEDFLVSYYKYINPDWSEYFEYIYETDVFKGIVLEDLCRINVPLHDYAYKQKIMSWARLKQNEPLLIDALHIYMRNVDNVSYAKLYFKLTEIKEENPFDFLVKNVKDLDTFCFGVAYLKFSTNLPISDEYLLNLLPEKYIYMYRVLWWQCELWKSLGFDKIFNVDYNGEWLDDTSKGLNACLEQLRTELLLIGVPAFSLTPEKHYLDVSCEEDSETINTDQLLLDSNKDEQSAIEILDNEIDGGKIDGDTKADNLEIMEFPKSQEAIKTLDWNKIFYDDIAPVHYDRVICKLREMTIGLKGKDFAIVIRAAYEAKILKIAPSYDLLQKIGFRDFGARSNYMRVKSLPLQINSGINGDKEVVPYQLDIYNNLINFKNEIVSE